MVDLQKVWRGTASFKSVLVPPSFPIYPLGDNINKLTKNISVHKFVTSQKQTTDKYNCGFILHTSSFPKA